MEFGTNKQGALTNESWGASGTRGSFGILRLGARCSETNMTNLCDPMTNPMVFWLVVWNIFYFPYIGNNHPN